MQNACAHARIGARRMFDELESHPGVTVGDGGGVMERVVATFFAELDGLAFGIGVAVNHFNRVSLLTLCCGSVDKGIEVISFLK